MQYGYVFTDPKRSKIAVLTKQCDVEYLSTNTKENINKAYCLRDISTMKVLYTALRDKLAGLFGGLPKKAYIMVPYILHIALDMFLLKASMDEESIKEY